MCVAWEGGESGRHAPVQKNCRWWCYGERLEARRRIEGVDAIDMRVIGGIFASWLITLPVGGLLAAAFFYLLKFIFS